MTTPPPIFHCPACQQIMNVPPAQFGKTIVSCPAHGPVFIMTLHPEFIKKVTG